MIVSRLSGTGRLSGRASDWSKMTGLNWWPWDITIQRVARHSNKIPEMLEYARKYNDETVQLVIAEYLKRKQDAEKYLETRYIDDTTGAKTISDATIIPEVDPFEVAKRISERREAGLTSTNISDDNLRTIPKYDRENPAGEKKVDPTEYITPVSIGFGLFRLLTR